MLQGCYDLKLHPFSRCLPWYFRGNVCKKLLTQIVVNSPLKVQIYMRLVIHLFSALIFHLVMLVSVITCSRCTCCVRRDIIFHDDVIKWKRFPRYWPFVRGIRRSPVNSPHKGQWRGTLMFSLICVWINGWVNNREAGDLRRYRTHNDVTVMYYTPWIFPGAHLTVNGASGYVQAIW